MSSSSVKSTPPQYISNENRTLIDPNKSVTFNQNTVETSFGGTQSVGKLIKADSLASDIGSTTENNVNVDKRYLSSETNLDGFNYTLSNSSFTNTINNDIEHNVNISIKGDTTDRSISAFYTAKSRKRRHTIGPLMSNSTIDISFNDSFSSVNDSFSRVNSSFIHEQNGCSITVAVRVRPFNSRELLDPNLSCAVSMHDNKTSVITDAGHSYSFMFDYSFWSFDSTTEFHSQSQVYTLLAQPLLLKAFEGYNVCLFAYGQTGSGKSYSMSGLDHEPGIIPRFCEDIFTRLNVADQQSDVTTVVEISYLEIYNEKIYDLLVARSANISKRSKLRIREHPDLGPYVEGLSLHVVKSFDDLQTWLTVGGQYRATSSTWMNDRSSRSHSVFTIIISQTKSEMRDGVKSEDTITSRINLVDLAGSERHLTSHSSDERFREGMNINKSLSTLGKVITMLAERSSSSVKRQRTFISYRDSTLTWLLKESLGGNSTTAMLATISPANTHLKETLSTLRFASHARKIVNIVKVNENPKEKIIQELRAEIESLKSQTNFTAGFSPTSNLAEVASLKRKLIEKEKQMVEMNRSWLEKLANSEAKKIEELKSLEKSGISVKVENHSPNLVNLNEDPQLSEMLLYIIREGTSRVGRLNPSCHHDIQLSGHLIAEDHCVLTNNEGVVRLVPLGTARSYVNGHRVDRSTILHHKDRIVLGEEHYFRLNHPLEVFMANKDPNSNSNATPIDFEYARHELLRVQEERMNRENESDKKRMLKEMEEELEQHRNEYEQKIAHYADKIKEKDNRVQTAEKEIFRLEQKVSSQLSDESSEFLTLLLNEESKVKEKLTELRKQRNEMNRRKIKRNSDGEERCFSYIKSETKETSDSVYSEGKATNFSQIYKEYVLSTIESLKDDSHDDSFADKCYRSLDIVCERLSALLNPFASPDAYDRDLREVSLTLTVEYSSLRNVCSMMNISLSSFQSEIINELCSHMTSLLESIGSQIIDFYQTPTGEKCLINDSVNILIQSLYSLATVCGEISLASDLTFNTLPQYHTNSHDSQGGATLFRHFLTGTNNYVQKTIDGASEAFNDWETHFNDALNVEASLGESLQKYMKTLVYTCKDFLVKCQAMQEASLFGSIDEQTTSDKMSWEMSYQLQGDFTHSIASLVDHVIDMCCIVTSDDSNSEIIEAKSESTAVVVTDLFQLITSGNHLSRRGNTHDCTELQSLCDTIIKVMEHLTGHRPTAQSDVTNYNRLTSSPLDTSSTLTPGEGNSSSALTPGEGNSSSALTPGEGNSSSALTPGEGNSSFTLTPGEGNSSFTLTPGEGNSSSALSFQMEI